MHNDIIFAMNIFNRNNIYSKINLRWDAYTIV